jgi:hypothetical protein
MEGSAGGTLIGEMAHIIADKANGPRGDEAIEEQHLRSYDNLILLCANHHAEIDDDPATYTIEYLRNLKAEHEAWVNLRLGSPVISTGVEISYVIVSGDSGLDELEKGSGSEVFGVDGRNFKLVRGEPLTWALSLQKLCYPWLSPRLDWEALRTLGAPISPLKPSFPLRRELIQRDIDPSILIKSEFGWVELSNHNCPGVDPVDELASLDPRLGASAREWCDMLRAWIIKNIETRTRNGELQALLPTIKIREPLFYCLSITAREHAGKSLRLFDQGRPMQDVMIDDRPILIPLGCVFEDPAEEKWRIYSTDCEMLDRDGSLGMVDFGTTMVYADASYLSSSLIGPRMLFDGFAIQDASGRIAEHGDIRPPYRVREYINCWFYGGSCPEIFFRTNSAGGWKYLGAALEGAIGPAKARSEDLFIADVRIGDRVEILILEVPGEVAFISAEVLFSPGQGPLRPLLQRRDVTLSPNDRIYFDFTANAAGRIEVRLVGYFEKVPLSVSSLSTGPSPTPRTPDVRHSNPARPS